MCHLPKKIIRYSIMESKSWLPITFVTLHSLFWLFLYIQARLREKIISDAYVYFFNNQLFDEKESWWHSLWKRIFYNYNILKKLKKNFKDLPPNLKKKITFYHYANCLCFLFFSLSILFGMVAYKFQQ